MTRDVMTLQLYREPVDPAPRTVAGDVAWIVVGSTLLCLVGMIGWLLVRG